MLLYIDKMKSIIQELVDLNYTYLKENQKLAIMLDQTI